MAKNKKLIGVVSDTHENEDAMKKAVAVFKEKKVDFVVHCGDIVSPPVLENFKELKMKIVFGNNDGEKDGLNKKAKELGFEEISEEKEFEYENKKFYVYHGTNQDKLHAAIESQKYDYVLTGHTHTRRDNKIGRTRIINPGALFRAYPYTIALLDVRKDNLKCIDIEKNKTVKVSDK